MQKCKNKIFIIEIAAVTNYQESNDKRKRRENTTEDFNADRGNALISAKKKTH